MLSRGMAGALRTLREDDPAEFDRVVKALMPTAPAKATEPAPTPKRTPAKQHREAEQLLDAGARRMAVRLGVSVAEGYVAFLREPEGQQLYRIYVETPAELPAIQAEPARFAESPAAASVVAEVEAKARRFREANPRLTEVEAEVEVWRANPDLYDRYLAAGGR